MAEPECAPVTVEGTWSPSQSKTARNKLQLYFQSKKKSSGGDCRVEAEDGAPRAAVYFTSEEVRRRVLARQNHEIILDNKTIELRLISASTPPGSDKVSDSSTDSKTPKSEPESGNGASAEKKDEPESAESLAVLLENVTEDMSRDLLSMMVENISGLDENSYSVEIIFEVNGAVITFNSPADVEKFLTMSQSSQKMQRHGLTARLLEAPKSVRVESLPPTAVKDILEMYFEKNWVLPDSIVMIPDEQAAILTFSDPKVVKTICVKEDYVMQSIPIKVYPYSDALCTALYGTERPSWKLPKPFTEKVDHVIWKFLLMKKLLKTINSQMSPYFCSVDLDSPDVKLSPLPSLLRQKGLNAQQLDMWMSTAQEAFRQQMSQYTAFECSANAPAWKAAEKEVRSVVKEDAILVPDTSRGVLTVAGQADDIKQIRARVENIVHKAMSQIERQTNGVSEVMSLSPAMFYILKQEGLQKAALDISPDMKVSYDESTQKLTITGLSEEVLKTKSWILEKNVGMSKKWVDVAPQLLNFLNSVDPMDMSQCLFTSKGISAIYSIQSKGVLLLGSSDSVLVDAESKMKAVLSVQTLDVEDQEVMKLKQWHVLNQQVLDPYSTSENKTLAVQIHPEGRDKITVVGFQDPVKEVSRSLEEFIVNYSQVNETLRVKSCAVVQFIDKKKTQDWSSIAKTNDVTVRFDEEKLKIHVAGARLHVQKVKSCFQELASALFTDKLIVDKPGAKKYFMTQGSMFLSTVMSELSCVVVLCPENEEEEEQEEEEDFDVVNGDCYCKVKTANGVLVSVSKADICSFSADAVVNAANEGLEHIDGLALALVKAAGPELQKISNDYTAEHGYLRPGDAIVTDAFNLPCKHVVHAVGPRFSDYNKKTSVSHLKLAVKESLRQAEKVNCSTIALPAISSGAFGFPLDLCAETIAQAVREYCDSPGGLKSLTEIHLVDNNDNTVRGLATAINAEFSDLGPTMTVPQKPKGNVASGRYHRGGGQSQSPRGGRFGRGGGAEGAEAGFQGDRQDGRRGHARRGGHGGPGRMAQEGLKIVLHQGNIQDQSTDVIVNTISENMDLSMGAVSKAILQAAGHNLQSAILSEAQTATLQYGEVVVTNGFNLKCQKVFHAVCPHWDTGAGQAEEDLKSIIRFCLNEAEKQRMASLSFPAIGTGNLNFPRNVVSRVLRQEIHFYSSIRTPQHLREVAIVVHPSDSQTVDCFTREFQDQTVQRNIEYEAQEVNDSPAGQSLSQSQQSSASIGQVLSPSLGVYRIQMGQLILEVSSGDITKEACDVIINASNPDFTLKSGVSKAILDSAGPTVEQECSKIVNSPGYQPRPMILTSAGMLPSRQILHIVGLNDPARIKDVVYSVLKFCEENKFNSVAFPALGTGQGGASPSAVADAMVEAVVDFVKKKRPKSVHSVKILIFQTGMMTEFHKSMKKREGQEVEEKSFLGKIKNSFQVVAQFFMGSADEQPSSNAVVLEREEFEPTVFQLCADNKKAVSQAKQRIMDLIVAEQAEKTITDSFINQLSQDDMDKLKDLQKNLTVSIRLDRGMGDQEPQIHIEGLTRDVFTAESTVRDIIRKVERTENLRSKAVLVSGLIEWQFPNRHGKMVAFDMYTNLELEEALEKKQNVKIKINNESYNVDVEQKRAYTADERKMLELVRKELKNNVALPPQWDDMNGDLLKLFPLTAGSKEYTDVETELTSRGLHKNIISIERVQNPTLWQSYQLMKKQLEVKNKHVKNERQLFHGTKATSIELINKQGFNRSYAGTNGAIYGRGAYFAVDPNYSAKDYAPPDNKGHMRMYFARVLVGEFIKGRDGMLAPPAKSSVNTADLYDSVVDDASNPNIFVIFNDIQAYPEYLITFT